MTEPCLLCGDTDTAEESLGNESCAPWVFGCCLLLVRTFYSGFAFIGFGGRRVI